jgi:ankyrin repeat protein
MTDSQRKRYATIEEAISAGDLIGVKYFVEKWGTHIKERIYREALRISILNGHLEIVKYLIEDCDVKEDAPDNRPIIPNDTSEDNILRIVKLFDKKGVSFKERIYCEALQEGAIYGHLDIVKYMVKKYTNIDNSEALHWSALYGHLDIVKYLVEQGANVHVNNNSAIKTSAYHGHLEIVKFLVEQGADIHAYNDYALRKSARNGYLEIVKYLVEHGADVNAMKTDALRCAILDGHFEIVKYLIEHGANRSIIKYHLLPQDKPEYQKIVEYLNSI